MDLTPHLTPQNKLLGIIVPAAFQIFAHSCHFGPKNQAQSLAPLKNDKKFRSIFCHFATLAASLDLHMHNFCQNFTWNCFLSIPAGNRSHSDTIWATLTLLGITIFGLPELNVGQKWVWKALPGIEPNTPSVKIARALYHSTNPPQLVTHTYMYTLSWDDFGKQ